MTIGPVGNFAQEAVKELNLLGISAAHYDLRFVKPLGKAINVSPTKQCGLRIISGVIPCFVNGISDWFK